MTKKISQQAMRVTLSQLVNLKYELLKEQQDLQKELGLGSPVDFDQSFQINIINKTPECSDTWEFKKWKQLQNLIN